MQRGAQVGGGVVEGRLRRRHRAAHVEIAVDQAGIVAPSDGDAGGLQPVGIGDALVLQRVEAGGVDGGGRQAGEVFIAQRRHARIGAVGRAGIAVAEPGHVRRFQQVAVGEGLARREAAGHVGRRVDQQLEAGQGQTGLAGLVAQHGGEVAAGAVAADRDARRVDAVVRRPGQHRLPHEHDIVHGRGERMLRGQCVIDREHPAIRPGGQPAAGPVVGVEAADGPAAAVEPDQQRIGPSGSGSGLLRRVEARADEPAFPPEGDLDHRVHRRRIDVELDGGLVILGAGGRRRESVDRRVGRFLDEVEHPLDLGVHGHAGSPNDARSASAPLASSSRSMPTATKVKPQSM